MPNHSSLLPILGFDDSFGIFPRKIVLCRHFILRAVATFWLISLVGFYPGRASYKATVNEITSVKQTKQKLPLSKQKFISDKSDFLLSNNNKRLTAN